MSKLIHFAGALTEAEKERLSAVIEELERTCNRSALPEMFGAPWICTCYRDHHLTVFAAHRLGLSESLVSGKSVDELTDHLRASIGSR